MTAGTVKYFKAVYGLIVAHVDRAFMLGTVLSTSHELTHPVVSVTLTHSFKKVLFCFADKN